MKTVMNFIQNVYENVYDFIMMIGFIFLHAIGRLIGFVNGDGE